MKKDISLMSILALAACASGGSPDGRFTVTSTSRIPFVTENAITSNQDVTSMDSAVVVCDGNCPAIVGKYISDMNSLRPHRDASVAANTEPVYNTTNYHVYDLSNVKFTTADAPGTEKFVFYIDKTENSKNRGRIESVQSALKDNEGQWNRQSKNTFANSDNSATFTYNSYDSMVNEQSQLNLRFSDFGKVTITGANGKDYMFAGGYKKLHHDVPTSSMTFTGNAVGVVSNGANTQEIDGDANLSFDNGNETLNMNFTDWYDVEIVKSGNTTEKITFTDKADISDAYKLTGFDTITNTKSGDAANVKTDIGYYGNGDNIKEATGVVNYTEGDINMQAAFGAKLNETNTNN